MRLLSEGRVVFSREEAQKELGVGRRAFLDAAERQQRRKLLISPRGGFYVIVPPPPSILDGGHRRLSGISTGSCITRTTHITSVF